MKTISLMLASALLVLGTQAFADDPNGNPVGGASATPGMMPKGAQVCECNLNQTTSPQDSEALKAAVLNKFNSALPGTDGTEPTPAANGAKGTR